MREGLLFQAHQLFYGFLSNTKGIPLNDLSRGPLSKQNLEVLK